MKTPGGPLNTPAPKKARHSDSSQQPAHLLATPRRVLKGFQDGTKLTKGKVIQALCNCVISAVDGKDGDEDSSAVELLQELLQLEGVDPNCTNEQVHALCTLVVAVSMFKCVLSLPTEVRLHQAMTPLALHHV
jgi:hypothetical protein